MRVPMVRSSQRGMRIGIPIDSSRTLNVCHAHDPTGRGLLLDEHRALGRITDDDRPKGGTR